MQLTADAPLVEESTSSLAAEAHRSLGRNGVQLMQQMSNYSSELGRSDIKSILKQLDPSLLLLVLLHMTNDFSLLRKYAGRFKKKVAPPSGAFSARDWVPKYASPIYSVDDKTSAEIINRLTDSISKRSFPLLAAPEDVFFQRMISFCVADDIPADDVQYYKESMGFITQNRTLKPTKLPPEDFKVFVMGAGMIGINAAIKLKEAGFNFVVVEKRDEVGGVWSLHEYPGAAVDIPALLYSFSFEPRKTWRTHYPQRDEYLSYLKDVASKYDIMDRIEFGTEVTACRWDDDRQLWIISAIQGGRSKIYEANAFIAASGQQTRAVIPEFEGMDKFEGKIIHPTHWDPKTDVAGKKVVVVGTGATAVQVVPAIAGRVESLTVVQRQPTWLLPNTLLGVPLEEAERWARQNLPYYMQWSRARTWYLAGFAPHNQIIRVDPEWQKTHETVSAANDYAMRRCLAYLQEKLADRPDLLSKMKPDYPMFAKYPVGDCGYLESLKRDNVALKVGSIRKFDPDGVVLTDGEKVECDIAVMATGFDWEFLSFLDVEGLDGKKLNEIWKNGREPYAYMGMLVPGFPNFFVPCGPNSIALGGGHSFISESAVHYIVEFLQTLIENDVSSMEPTPEETARQNEEIDAYLDRTVFKQAGGANGWFRTQSGRVRALGMWSGIEAWKMHRAPDLSKFIARSPGLTTPVEKD